MNRRGVSDSGGDVGDESARAARPSSVVWRVFRQQRRRSPCEPTTTIPPIFHVADFPRSATSRDASCTFGCCRHRDLHYRSRAPPLQFRAAREWFKPIVCRDVTNAVFVRLSISLIVSIELNEARSSSLAIQAAPRLFDVPRRRTATPRIPRSIWTRPWSIDGSIARSALDPRYVLRLVTDMD